MADWNGFDSAAPYALSGGAGLIGRLMYHARMVQSGQRKPLSWTLLWDVPIAFGMGWAAYGLCAWYGLPVEPTISGVIAASYLGPYSVDRAFALLAERYFKGGAT